MPRMYLGFLGPIILVIILFGGIGLGAYAEHLNKKDKKRVAEATTINKK